MCELSLNQVSLAKRLRHCTCRKRNAGSSPTKAQHIGKLFFNLILLKDKRIFFNDELDIGYKYPTFKYLFEIINYS